MLSSRRKEENSCGCWMVGERERDRGHGELWASLVLLRGIGEELTSIGEFLVWVEGVNKEQRFLDPTATGRIDEVVLDVFFLVLKSLHSFFFLFQTRKKIKQEDGRQINCFWALIPILR